MSNKNEKNKKQLIPLETKFEALRTVVAIGIALLIIIVTVALVSDNPLEAVKALMLGPLASVRRFANVIELMIPLSFTGLAVAIILKTQRYNFSVEGAFYLGAVVTAWIGINSPLPPFATILVALLVAPIVGAMVGFIPTYVNKKFHANELVTALMLNHAVAFLVKYILNYKIRDISKSVIQSVPLKAGVALPRIIPGTRIHLGLLIMLALVFVAWVVIYKTKWGYALRATGLNEGFAKYTGIKVSSVIVVGQILGTAIAGIGGSVEMLGIYKTFQWTETPGYGFDGVIISVLARGNPAMVPFAAFFLAYIRVGADILNRTTDIPAEIVSIVQATLILLISAQAFLAAYKHRMVVKETGALENVKEGA